MKRRNKIVQEITRNVVNVFSFFLFFFFVFFFVFVFVFCCFFFFFAIIAIEHVFFNALTFARSLGRC